MSWLLDGRPVRSVLLTRLRYLGDIVMSTVLVEVLRRGDPDLDIGYLCEEGFTPVLDRHPGINRIHGLRSGRSGSDAAARIRVASSMDSRGTLGTVIDLRNSRYDLAVDLFFNPRSAWLLKLSGIPQRIGGTEKSRGRLYTHRALRRHVDAGFPGFGSLAPGGLGDHLCRLGPLTDGESGADFSTWLKASFQPGDLKPRLGEFIGSTGTSQVLESVGIGPGEPYLLAAPCATWESKEWPLERWAELIPLLLERTELSLAVMVAPGKEGKWAGLAGLIPGDRGGLLPAVPLPEALRLTAGATALVTVDGGIMHAAVGLDVPTVAIFGPTDPAIWFPYGKSGPFRVLARAPHCHPCDLHECRQFICLPELEPGSVWQALAPLLENGGRSEGGVR